MLFQDLKNLFFFNITSLAFRPRGLPLSLFFAYYCPQTKFAKGMFLYVSVYPRGEGHAWQEACVAGGVHGRGACVARRGGVHGGGHAWQGACMAEGAWCMAGGGEGTRVALGIHDKGGIHGRGMHDRGHVW